MNDLALQGVFMKLKDAFILINLFVISIFCGFSCKQSHSASSAEKSVCVTTYPIWLLTRQVMEGSQLKPILVIPAETGCPHDYSLTPNALMKIKDGALLLANGGGLDQVVIEAIQRVTKDIRVKDTSLGIKLIHTEDYETADGEKGKHVEEPHHEHAEGHHHHESSINGHFFTSPFCAIQIVENIVSGLCEYNPEESDLYRRNEEKILDSLREICKSYQETLKTEEKIRISTQHDVFHYFFRDLGYPLPISIFIDADITLSPSELTSFARQCQENHVKYFIVDMQCPGKLAKMISETAKLQLIQLDSLASGEEDVPLDYYEQKMLSNLEIIKQNFNL